MSGVPELLQHIAAMHQLILNRVIEIEDPHASTKGMLPTVPLFGAILVGSTGRVSVLVALGMSGEEELRRRYHTNTQTSAANIEYNNIREEYNVASTTSLIDSNIPKDKLDSLLYNMGQDHGLQGYVQSGMDTKWVEHAQVYTTP